MTHNTAYELPSQRFGEVIPHDRYTPRQEELFKIIDAFGQTSVGQIVELEADSLETPEQLTGQYF